MFMKNHLKRIIKILVFIPNTPVLVTIAAYTLYKIYQNSDILDKQRMLQDPLYYGVDMDKIKEYGEYVWTNSVRILVAIMFYIWLILF